jgi:hypothetical protein
MDDNFLQCLPDERKAAVAGWLQSSLCECRVCGKPVRPIDPRVIDKRAVRADDDERPGVMHLGCRDA